VPADCAREADNDGDASADKRSLGREVDLSAAFGGYVELVDLGFENIDLVVVIGHRGGVGGQVAGAFDGSESGKRI